MAVRGAAGDDLSMSHYLGRNSSSSGGGGGGGALRHSLHPTGPSLYHVFQ